MAPLVPQPHAGHAGGAGSGGGGKRVLPLVSQGRSAPGIPRLPLSPRVPAR